MPVKPYGIYLARFQFIESRSYKVRPVVAVSKPTGKHNTVLAIPLSSRPEREPIDIAISQWQSSGLIEPTVARVHRLTAIMGANILEDIGGLQQQDIESLQKALRKAFGL